MFLKSTPFHDSCRIESFDTANELSKLLLDHGAEVTQKNSDGRIPFGYCGKSSQGHLDICKLLLERMSPEKEGYGEHLDRALQRAAQHGHEGVVDLLVAAGAPLSPPYEVALPLVPFIRKWKDMYFAPSVEDATKKRILGKLAQAPSKSWWRN